MILGKYIRISISISYFWEFFEDVYVDYFWSKATLGHAVDKTYFVKYRKAMFFYLTGSEEWIGGSTKLEINKFRGISAFCLCQVAWIVTKSKNFQNFEQFLSNFMSDS